MSAPNGIALHLYVCACPELINSHPSFARCICGHRRPSQPKHQQRQTTVAASASTTTFSAVAAHLKLPYDAAHDYNPQFDGYTRGTVIKQADTVLIGYPLLYAYNDTAPSTAAALRNNLAYYESVMRSTGPAMTWSMHAVQHLQQRPRDPAAVRHADVLFQRGWRPYVRAPFLVSESIRDWGACEWTI